MGTWGAGSFDNDAVLDWLADLEEGEAHVVREALAAAADADEKDYLDADEAQPALAAAEIVAAARGRGDDRIAAQDDLLAWLAGRREAFGEADLTLARRAVERVLAKSELQELWDDNGPDNEWRPVVNELLRRLQPSGAGAKKPIAAKKPLAAKKPTPSKKPVATKSKKPVAAKSKKPAATKSKKPVAARPKKPVAARARKPAAAKSKKSPARKAN